MKFKPLLPEDYPYFKKYFKNQRYLLCGYSLSSIMAWTNDLYQPYGAEHNGSLLVAAEFTAEPQNRHLILPICPHRESSPKDLRDIAVQAGHTSYWFVPDDYIDRYGREAFDPYFEIKNHGAYDDYVYRVEDLALLKGKRYSRKRNLIHQFQRIHSDADRVTVAPIQPEDRDECLDFIEEWCQVRDCDSDLETDLACEKQAAINTIINMDIFQLKGLLLRIDGKVSAYGIAAHLTDEMAALQYEKAFAHIKGLYQYFDNICAKRLFSGYRYINKESDMGMPGLAKMKKSYYPIMMIKSQRLVLK